MGDNKEIWYTRYEFRYGKLRASTVHEPTKVQWIGVKVDNITIFASEQEARNAFKKRLTSHVESIIHGFKDTSLNKALLNRLKEYDAKGALEALKIVQQILKSIPDKIDD